MPAPLSSAHSLSSLWGGQQVGGHWKHQRLGSSTVLGPREACVLWGVLCRARGRAGHTRDCVLVFTGRRRRVKLKGTPAGSGAPRRCRAWGTQVEQGWDQ